MIRVEVGRRPLSQAEREIVRDKVETALAGPRGELSKSVRQAVLLWAVAAGILGLLWWRTIAEDRDRTKAAVSSLVSGLGLALVTGWELRSRRGAVRSAEASWRTAREANQVIEIDVRPLRAWRASDIAWIFDAGDGWGLFANWEVGESPGSRIVYRRVSAELSWLEQEGPPCECLEIDFDGDDLPDEHPLMKKQGPALFRLGVDPGRSLTEFREGRFPLEA